jgi:predicted nuclease of restriction endonuclease-like RecB superfamily
LLPRPLLVASVHLEGERIVPHYFTARDEPWLAALLAEYASFTGRKCSELHERLRAPLPTRAPKLKLRVAMLVLDALSRTRPNPALPPKQARAALFRAAAHGSEPRLARLGSVAASLSVSVVELEDALFADLRSERLVAALPVRVSPSTLASDANLALVSSLIGRATQVSIVLRRNAQALIRHARVSGLMCREIRAARVEEPVTLDISGPLSLFHHSDVYSRALSSLIPRLAHCGRFELSATCALARRGPLSTLLVTSADPLHGPELSPLESHSSRQFEQDFQRIAPEWKLTRGPAAIGAGERAVFADFELAAHDDPTRSWLLEIIGFSTPEYVREKLARLRAVGGERFVLCVDRSRQCGDGELPRDPRVLCYRRRIDARAVLALLTANRS